MKTHKDTERPVELHDCVQSLKTKSTYSVVFINPDTGRPNLWAHGHRRIRNANPKRYRIIERREVPHGQPA